MTITKNYAGAWVVSDTIDGYLVTKSYYGYTRAEALAMFKQKEN